jgi:acyl-CoA synthetase (AMP-forming)/AMP-acid ligase II
VYKSSDGNFAGRLVQRLGSNSCLVDAATGHALSGRDVARLVLGFAAGFLSLGVRSGDRLLISCGVTPASTLAYLGAMYAGIVPIPFEERLLSTSRDLLAAKAHAKGIWTASKVGSECVEHQNLLHIEGSFTPQDLGSLPPMPCAEEDLAVLMPTSGSSGTPRLVMVSHGNLWANTEAIIRSQYLGTDEKAMLIMPVSYCFGASVMHTHLYQGGGVVFDSRFMFPDKVLHAINTYGCTTFAGVPLVYNILLRRSNIRSVPLPTLRRFLQAGGALAPESVREMCTIAGRAEFFVMYGQTEATARISCMSATELTGKIGSAGLPLDNIELRIVDEYGWELPKGEVGEIQVRGPSVCSGYLDDPEGTKSKFTDAWLNTRDFGSVDDDGYLWIKGRTDEFIKIRGVRVGVGEVEAALAAIPGVYECAVTGVPHPEAGEALAIFVVAENGTDGLTASIRRALPPQWTCASVKLVSELPRTANGKVARAQLRTLA